MTNPVDTPALTDLCLCGHYYGTHDGRGACAKTYSSRKNDGCPCPRFRPGRGTSSASTRHVWDLLICEDSLEKHDTTVGITLDPATGKPDNRGPNVYPRYLFDSFKGKRIRVTIEEVQS